MMNLGVVNIKEYSLLSPDFIILNINLITTGKFFVHRAGSNGSKFFLFFSKGPVKKRPVKKKAG